MDPIHDHARLPFAGPLPNHTQASRDVAEL